jgi:hypothetical protein
MNGNGCDDLVAARQIGGLLYFFYHSLTDDGSTYSTVQWGLAGDRILPPIDMNGDGRADVGVVRRFGIYEYVFFRLSGTGAFHNGRDAYKAFLFGLAGDVAVAGDYSGINQSSYAILRRGAPDTLFIRNLGGSGVKVQPLGRNATHVVGPDGMARGLR